MTWGEGQGLGQIDGQSQSLGQEHGDKSTDPNFSVCLPLCLICFMGHAEREVMWYKCVLNKIGSQTRQQKINETVNFSDMQLRSCVQSGIHCSLNQMYLLNQQSNVKQQTTASMVMEKRTILTY